MEKELNNDQKIILDILLETKEVMSVIGKSRANKYPEFKRNWNEEGKGKLEDNIFNGLLKLRLAKGNRL